MQRELGRIAVLLSILALLFGACSTPQASSAPSASVAAAPSESAPAESPTGSGVSSPANVAGDEENATSMPGGASSGARPGATSSVSGKGRAASIVTILARATLPARGCRTSENRTASSGMSVSRASRASTGTR